MNNLFFLIPIALFLGALGLAGFLWALRNGQYEDLKGAAERILIDDEDLTVLDHQNHDRRFPRNGSAVRR